MTSKKKGTKIVIILILFVFLLITALSAIVPYLGGNKTVGTGDVLSGNILSGDIIAQTGTDISESTELPKMTSGEATRRIQEMLSGITTSK
ncbi:MAG: hypothetical protein WC010_01205 [Candidatus Absconditabacterales bacterium]